MGLAGILWKVLFRVPRSWRHELISVGFYLLMGWLILLVLEPFVAAVAVTGDPAAPGGRAVLLLRGRVLPDRERRLRPRRVAPLRAHGERPALLQRPLVRRPVVAGVRVAGRAGFAGGPAPEAAGSPRAPRAWSRSRRSPGSGGRASPPPGATGREAPGQDGQGHQQGWRVQGTVGSTTTAGRCRRKGCPPAGGGSGRPATGRGRGSWPRRRRSGRRRSTRRRPRTGRRARATSRDGCRGTAARAVRAACWVGSIVRDRTSPFTYVCGVDEWSPLR